MRAIQSALRANARNPWLVWGVLSIAATLGCDGKEKAPPPPPPKVEVPVMAPIQRDVPIYVEVVGQTKGASDVEVRARAEGWIEGLHFREGTEVQKGARLYSIDPRPLQEKVAAAEGALATAQAQLAQARSQVSEMRSQVVEATARVAAAEAQLQRFQGDVDKYRPLVAINAVSRRDLDTAVAQRDTAQEQVNAAREGIQAAEQRTRTAEGGVGAAQGGVDAAMAQLRSAQINLGYTEIQAPISGLIGKSKVEFGDFVGGAAVLDTISIIDPIHVEFSIDERQYMTLARAAGERTARQSRSGLELILADGSTHPHLGTINFADRQVDPKTGSLLLQASFPNPDKILRPGQFARVRGKVDVREGALLVPQRAVQEVQGQYQVFVVGAGDKIEARNVKLSERVGELWVAEEGLKADDRVIVDGLQRLRAGMEVVPKVVAPPPESGQPAAAAPAPAGAGQ